MKLNLAAVIYDLDGKTAAKFKDTKDSPERDMTLKDVLIGALATKLREDTELSPKANFDLFELAEKIEVGGEVEITSEQATTLQARLPKTHPLVVAGRAHKMLNG